MSRLTIVRFVAVLAGAATLFGMQQGLGLELYIAFPTALIVYFGIKVVLGLALNADKPT